MRESANERDQYAEWKVDLQTLSLCHIRIHTIVDGRSAASVGRANKEIHPRQSVAEKKSDTPKLPPKAAWNC
jgi:hypothetical protein